MRHDDHRAALGGDLAQHVEHDRGRLRVEVARRLVREHDRRVVHEGAREGDALLLAAGQLVRHPAGRVLQAEPLDERPAALQRAGRRVGQPRGECDVLLARQLGHEVEELEDEADPPRAQTRQVAFGAPVDALARELDRPGLRAVQTAQQVQQRRLPRARAAHDGHELPGVHLERRAIEHTSRGPTVTRRS